MRYIGLILLVITLTSCLEGDDDSFRATSSVLFVNAYNDADNGVDFRVNDRGWNKGHKAYDSIGTYNVFYSGDVTFSAFPAGGSAGPAVAGISGTLGAGQEYTCFLTGRAGEGKMVFLPDTARAPAGEKAVIRFLNLSPDLSMADVEIADSGIVINDLNYLHAGYMTVDTGDNVIRALRPGAAQAVASLSFRAASGGVYTMYTRGLLSRDGSDSLAIRYFRQP